MIFGDDKFVHGELEAQGRREAAFAAGAQEDTVVLEIGGGVVVPSIRIQAVSEPEACPAWSFQPSPTPANNSHPLTSARLKPSARAGIGGGFWHRIIFSHCPPGRLGVASAAPSPTPLPLPG